jgi:uncharacterized LabA/DUF88 family protein
MDKHAAMFIDLENVFYFLRKTFGLTEEGATSASVDVIAYLLNDIEQKHGRRITIGRAYLDMDRTQMEVRRLSYLGIKPEHVTSTPQKSSADIELSLDALELLYRRPECETFYIVGGDRDYLQICRRLRESLKTVFVAGFEKALSADLREYVGRDNVILCDRMLDAAAYPQDSQVIPSVPPPPALSPSMGPPSPSSIGPPSSSRSSTMEWPKYRPADENYEWEERALLAIVRFQTEKNVREVWLNPFLYRMDADENFALMSSQERRGLISRLKDLGAIRVEVRLGEQGRTFSVVHVRRDHPLVRKVLDAA